MDDELHRKIKAAKSLHEKYIQMMDEHMVKEDMTNDVLLWNSPRNNSRLYTKRKKSPVISYVE